MGGDPQANVATEAFGGTQFPIGAANRVRDVPKWTGNCTRTLPLRPSAELPVGPRTVRVVCRNGRGIACELCH
eukprot:8212077-Pyramimonas_sp.AAC.1